MQLFLASETKYNQCDYVTWLIPPLPVKDNTSLYAILPPRGTIKETGVRVVPKEVTNTVMAPLKVLSLKMSATGASAVHFRVRKERL